MRVHPPAGLHPGKAAPGGFDAGEPYDRRLGPRDGDAGLPRIPSPMDDRLSSSHQCAPYDPRVRVHRSANRHPFRTSVAKPSLKSRKPWWAGAEGWRMTRLFRWGRPCRGAVR